MSITLGGSFFPFGERNNFCCGFPPVGDDNVLTPHSCFKNFPGMESQCFCSGDHMPLLLSLYLLIYVPNYDFFPFSTIPGFDLSILIGIIFISTVSLIIIKKRRNLVIKKDTF